MTLCKQDGIFINRPEIEPPVEGCVYAMSVDIGIMDEALLASEEIYALGDVVIYIIHVENTGTCDLENVTVTDESAGSVWNIPVLAEGEIYEIYSEYTITAEDIEQNENGTILFVTADSDEVHAQTHKDIAVDDAYSYMLADIWAEGVDGATWHVGDKFTINIGVYNTGNVRAWSVMLDMVDDLRSEEVTIPVLNPEESATFQFTHTVTSEDVSSGQFYIFAYLYWASADGVKTHTNSRTFRTLA